ncbi:class I SAM-dependent methyltransferase [Vandammella animalimorsus]|nr:methyltransferase domain-containing protein [Vandammella animalimorsus]
MKTNFYRAFEEAYRGPRALIMQRLQVYLPFVRTLQQVRGAALRIVDLGCGRGEWLELMQQQGCEVFGIDLDEGMLAACHELGLPVQQGDALQYLCEQPDASIDILSAFHVVEHLDFTPLETLVTQARRVLRPAGLLILETPNPENLVVGSCNFHLDPTHLKPIPPLLLEFLPLHHGFARSKTLRLQEKPALHKQANVSLINVLSGASPDYAVLAQQTASPEQLAPFNENFDTPYGLQLSDLAARYDQARSSEIAQLQQQLTQCTQRQDQFDQRWQQERDKANAQIQQWWQAMEQHATSVVRLSEQLLQTHAQLDQCRSALAAAEQARNNALQTAQQQRAHTQQWERERQQWTGQIRRLNAANQQLQAQCQAYRNSWSWKLTAPLRMGLDATRAIVRPHTWLPSALRKSADAINGSPRLNRSVRAILRHTPALERWLIEQAYGVSAAATAPAPANAAASMAAASPAPPAAPASSFEQFLQQCIGCSAPAGPQPIALAQNTVNAQQAMLDRVLARSAPGLNAQLILRLRSGARLHFIRAPQAGRDEAHLSQLVEHIYLVLLRRYPSPRDKQDKVRLLLKTHSIERLIESIQQSPEYRDRQLLP